MLLTAAALLGIVVVLAIGVWRGRYQRTTHRQVVTGIGVVYIGLTGWIFIVGSRDIPELLRSDLFVFGLVLLLYAATAWIRQSVGPGRAENPGKAPPNRAARRQHRRGSRFQERRQVNLFYILRNSSPLANRSSPVLDYVHACTHPRHAGRRVLSRRTWTSEPPSRRTASALWRVLPRHPSFVCRTPRRTISRIPASSCPGTVVASSHLGGLQKSRFSAEQPTGGITANPRETKRPLFCARRSDDTDAPTGKARNLRTESHLQAGSCQTAQDDGGKPGVRAPLSIETTKSFRTASLLGGKRQRRRRFCAFDRKRPRKETLWVASLDDRN